MTEAPAPIRTAVITGSTREGRFGPTVARWFHEVAAERADLELDLIDVADIDIRQHLPRTHTDAERDYVARIDAADAYVVITPEYNHGYPATLKQAIDLPHVEWYRKPVAFVSYGGFAGGLRAVEQLRQVFAELQMATIRDTVSFHGFAMFDDEGRLRDDAGPRAAATVMLDDLAWWATALRTARASVPASPQFASVIDYEVDGEATLHELADAFADIQRQWVRSYPGYVSSRILGSVDGTRLYNVVSWATEDDYGRFEAESDTDGRVAAIDAARAGLSGTSEPRMTMPPRFRLLHEVLP